jgi:hypothetical protein
MEIVDPEKIKLVPGESVHAVFSSHPDAREEVGFFVRAVSAIEAQGRDLGMEQRAGLIKFDDVLLVLTMIKVTRSQIELFDLWWNYHARDGIRHFQLMAEQERLTVHFYHETGKRFSVDTQNGFRKFFGDVRAVCRKSSPWTEVQFDRAVRGFCAQSYPKENLWQLIEMGSQPRESTEQERRGVGYDDYSGSIPSELRPFYTYLTGQGHCIKVIPSLLEREADQGNPEDYLLPAPVKTVLRCGIRWMRGFPVAPIPFIPGHGLAVPPEDTEL